MIEMFLVLFGGIAALDLAAWRWGVDSRDGYGSAEWERRRRWNADARGRHEDGA